MLCHGLAWAAVAAVGADFCLSLAAFGPQALATLSLRVALRWHRPPSRRW